MNPKITIITVVRNGKNSIEQTILSVLRQDFTNFEYLIIDGRSNDGTLEIIKDFELRIRRNEFNLKIENFNWISEPDKGIYDAMNKGVMLSKGEWLNFLNSGDRFVNQSVLSDTFGLDLSDKIDFIYSDWYFCNFKKNRDFIIPQEASYLEGNILHQSVIYKKKLHYEIGKYIVTPKLIIADYIFFNAINPECIYKSSIPISINDQYGVSSNYWSLEQKIAIDFVFHRITFGRMIYLYFRYFLHRLKKGQWILR